MPFFSRLWLAIVCFFKIVFDGQFAAKVAPLRAPPPAPPATPLKDRPTLPATPMAITAAQLSRAEQALYLLSLLQREGRFIDFVQEDIGAYADAQIGAAARSVHGGCRKALQQLFTFAPIRMEGEGAAVSIPGGFDARSIRLTGNVMGSPPFKGVLRHHGWKVTEIRMPQASGDPTLLAPAEVELP